MGYNNRRRGLFAVYITCGPFFAFTIYLIAMLALTKDFDVRVLHKISLVLLPIFYIVGLLPAILTAFLTERKISKSGCCLWYQSAGYGALSSALFIGAPFLFFGLVEAIRSGNISVFGPQTYLSGVPVILGFFGTIPVWYLTRARQAKLAAAFSESSVAK
jgi:hypothetical protein